MTAITATEARKTLFPLLERVTEDHTPVEITSKHGSAVLISMADYEALHETAYLLRSPANAERLLAALKASKRGGGRRRDLVTP